MVKRLYDIYKGELLTKAETIQRLRMQIAVHSYIYSLHKKIVSDEIYDNWKKELDEHRVKDRELFKEIIKFLPMDMERVINTANWLLARNENVDEQPKVEIKVKKSNFKKRLF